MEPTAIAILLGLSSLFQVVAALIALRQMASVSGRYRLAWGCVTLALAFMVQRRLAPLWRYLDAGITSNTTDAIVGLLISLLMAAGMLGIRRLFLDMRAQGERLDELARHDPLTGLANRREVLTRLKAELSRSQRGFHPLSLLIFDIDHFKQINDTHGHAAGDQVLKNIARSANQNLRVVDSCGRIGGEEFLVILPDTGSDQALVVAERMRAAVAGLKPAHDTLAVTISIGVVTCGGASIPAMEELLAAADRAMYVAKEAGRNRASVAPENLAPQ